MASAPGYIWLGLTAQIILYIVMLHKKLSSKRTGIKLTTLARKQMDIMLMTLARNDYDLGIVIILLILLTRLSLICGDIHPNPGPAVPTGTSWSMIFLLPVRICSASQKAS